MPLIRIPQTGTRIEWPPAAAGRVRVHGTLHLGKPGQAGFRIELSFKPNPFRRLFKQSEFWAYVRHVLSKVEDRWPPTPEALHTQLTRKELSLVRPVLPTYDPAQLTILQSHPPNKLLRLWGQKIVITLYDSVGSLADNTFHFMGIPPAKPLSRKKVQILDGSFQGLDFRLKINTEDLCAVYELLATEQGASRLTFEVTWYLLPSFLIDLALRGMPRGPKGVEQQNVMTVARCAIYVAKQLITAARKDRALRRRLGIVLSSEDCEGNFGENYQVMVLADRALRPALQKAGLVTLEGRNPSDLLDPESTRQLADMFAHLPDTLTWWFDLLLGPEGQVAHMLKLVR